MGLQRVGYTKRLSLIHWCRWHHPYGRKRNQRAFWWRWKKRVKKLSELNIQKMKIMVFGPITSRQIRGKMETVTDFILGDSKITANCDCSHEINRRLLLGRKAVTNLDSILKIRDITLPTTVWLVKVMVFPVVMYGCESWTIKKADHWKLMLLNCGVRGGSLECLGLQGDQTSPS